MKQRTQRERCEEIADYVIEYKTTVRQAANYFGISKSTVHKDITESLARQNKPLYAEVKAVLNLNKQERHLRGGEATRKKYRDQRKASLKT